MPFALLLKETEIGRRGDNDWKYEVLAVMPCCSYQKEARPKHFAIYGKRGELGATSLQRHPTTNTVVDYRRPPERRRRCNKCHRFLRLHVIVRKDETWRACKHTLSTDYGYRCEFRALPEKVYCGIHTDYEERHR